MTYFWWFGNFGNHILWVLDYKVILVHLNEKFRKWAQSKHPNFKSSINHLLKRMIEAKSSGHFNQAQILNEEH